MGWLSVGLLSGLSSACEWINPAEELPAYISFQHPMTSAPGDTTFRSDTGIRNIWLYHGGFLQGCYPLESIGQTGSKVIPILELSRSDFFLEGGIYESGQSSFQLPYPFWDRITFDWQATVGDTLVLNPVFHYVDPSRYDLPVSVGFEGGGVDFTGFASGRSGDSTFFKVRTDEAYRGTGSGLVEFGPGNRFFEVVNVTPWRTLASSNTYAEVTYKGTIPFTIGLIYGSTSSPNARPILTVDPSADWNTVYVHMIGEIRAILNANGPDTDFWLWLQADAKDAPGYIRFDEIRLIREP
ncbi:MAG: hypothetical protein RLZZ165_2048 [Bacteroidota bacterium]|jgi:hypothetical protein